MVFLSGKDDTGGEVEGAEVKPKFVGLLAESTLVLGVIPGIDGVEQVDREDWGR